MSRPQSDATALRIAHAELRVLRTQGVRLRTERASMIERMRAVEKELAEWKARFDILLKREGG